MNIPFIDLQAQQKRIIDRLRENIDRVLSAGQYIMGPEVKELEERLAAYCGTGHAIGCSSGTDALLMALMACDVGPGDAVFTTPFTFVATAEVCALVGATPVFVDIDPVTFNIDTACLENAICALEKADPGKYPLPEGYDKLRPRGIIAVDLFGQPADYKGLADIAAEHNLFVLEDAAQSFGASFNGAKACSLADIAATSFFPAKPLGAYGDGGMVFTDDDNLAQRLESVRVHGKGMDKYNNVRIGINGRLDTMQAAILLAKFSIFSEEIELRQQVADRYTRLLGPSSNIQCPMVLDGMQSAWAQYSLLSPCRQEILQGLKEKGIPWAIYYPIPLHLQSGYTYLGYTKGSFPHAEQAAERIFSLPMHPYLDAETQEYMAAVIREASL